MSDPREVVARAVAVRHPNASTQQVGADYDLADAVLAALRPYFAEIWAKAYGQGRDDEADAIDLGERPNPYRDEVPE